MDEFKKLSSTFLSEANADAVAIGVIDFKKNTSQTFEASDVDKSEIYFDLASLTKPFTNSFYAIANDLKDKELLALLNHRAGLLAWGILGRDWKKQILDYKITYADVLYSDFSALRFMLEIEKKLTSSYQKEVFKNLSSEIFFWKDLPREFNTVQNGFVHGKPNLRNVHDPNALNINEFTSHAGLFGTVKGVCETLMSFNEKFDLINKVKMEMKHNDKRFILGFDRVQDSEKTLAGKGCSGETFGHLGFTGTSFWIDAKQMKGHVILTNSTKYYWFDKIELNKLRKAVGELVWQS
jgi:hypothetical protein